MTSSNSATAQPIQRRIRLVAILAGAHKAGLTPLPLQDLHNIAYFADALAPVWGLRMIDAQLLKRRDGAFSPVLQSDLDDLVGRGVVRASDVAHTKDAEGAWRLSAHYALVLSTATRILKVAQSFDGPREHVHFVIELVQAMSALGLSGITAAPLGDAAYANTKIDFGSVLDLATIRGRINPTARVALRFGTLLEHESDLTSAEMIHLYVKELYKRLGRAA